MSTGEQEVKRNPEVAIAKRQRTSYPDGQEYRSGFYTTTSKNAEFVERTPSWEGDDTFEPDSPYNSKSLVRQLNNLREYVVSSTHGSLDEEYRVIGNPARYQHRIDLCYGKAEALREKVEDRHASRKEVFAHGLEMSGPNVEKLLDGLESQIQHIPADQERDTTNKVLHAWIDSQITWSDYEIASEDFYRYRNVLIELVDHRRFVKSFDSIEKDVNKRHLGPTELNLATMMYEVSDNQKLGDRLPTTVELGEYLIDFIFNHVDVYESGAIGWGEITLFDINSNQQNILDLLRQLVHQVSHPQLQALIPAIVNAIAYGNWAHKSRMFQMAYRKHYKDIEGFQAEGSELSLAGVRDGTMLDIWRGAQNTNLDFEVPAFEMARAATVLYEHFGVFKVVREYEGLLDEELEIILVAHGFGDASTGVYDYKAAKKDNAVLKAIKEKVAAVAGLSEKDKLERQVKLIRRQPHLGFLSEEQTEFLLRNLFSHMPWEQNPSLMEEHLRRVIQIACAGDIIRDQIVIGKDLTVRNQEKLERLDQKLQAAEPDQEIEITIPKDRSGITVCYYGAHLQVVIDSKGERKLYYRESDAGGYLPIQAYARAHYSDSSVGKVQIREFVYKQKQIAQQMAEVGVGLRAKYQRLIEEQQLRFTVSKETASGGFEIKYFKVVNGENVDIDPVAQPQAQVDAKEEPTLANLVWEAGVDRAAKYRELLTGKLRIDVPAKGEIEYYWKGVRVKPDTDLYKKLDRMQKYGAIMERGARNMMEPTYQMNINDIIARGFSAPFTALLSTYIYVIRYAGADYSPVMRPLLARIFRKFLSGWYKQVVIRNPLMAGKKSSFLHVLTDPDYDGSLFDVWSQMDAGEDSKMTEILRRAHEVFEVVQRGFFKWANVEIVNIHGTTEAGSTTLDELRKHLLIYLKRLKYKDMFFTITEEGVIEELISFVGDNDRVVKQAIELRRQMATGELSEDQVWRKLGIKQLNVTIEMSLAQEIWDNPKLKEAFVDAKGKDNDFIKAFFQKLPETYKDLTRIWEAFCSPGDVLTLLSDDDEGMATLWPQDEKDYVFKAPPADGDLDVAMLAEFKNKDTRYDFAKIVRRAIILARNRRKSDRASKREFNDAMAWQYLPAERGANELIQEALQT